MNESRRDYLLPASIALSAIMVASAWIYAVHAGKPTSSAPIVNDIQDEVAPPKGVVLPVTWGDLGKRMVAAGVIDEAQFKALYADRGGLPQDIAGILDASNSGRVVMNSQNAGMLLNVLWAFGLANENPILKNGPMQDPRYGGAGRFASTAGWTLVDGSAMSHYGAHRFVTLTPDEQSLVEAVSKGIYRPCCGNSAYFPDCNHGMAMLGLLELMASQGATANEMYKAALTANSYWFPDSYMTIAQYLESKGIAWNSVKPEDVLAADFSSAQGYQRVAARMQPSSSPSSGSCGV